MYPRRISFIYSEKWFSEKFSSLQKEINILIILKLDFFFLEMFISYILVLFYIHKITSMDKQLCTEASSNVI